MNIFRKIAASPMPLTHKIIAIAKWIFYSAPITLACAAWFVVSGLVTGGIKITKVKK